MTRRRRFWPIRLPRPGRAAARLSAAFMILGTVVLIFAAPASAGILGAGSCANPPAPQTPETAGMSQWVSGNVTSPPAAGTAFGAHADSTEYEQYGYAGLFWSTYNLGISIPFVACTAGPSTIGPSVDTTAGNMFLGAAKVYVAIDNQVHDWAASPAWINDLNPLVTSASRVMHDDLFVLWAGLALVIVGITVIARVYGGNFADAVTKMAWALLVLTLVGGVLNYPTLAGQATSSLMSQTLNALDAGFTGPGGQANAAKSHDSLIVTSVLYDQWIYGELGPAYTRTAQTYGPQLFQDQALTWQQAAASPQQVAQTEKNDESAWGKLAGQIQQADPAAYQNLQGTGVSRIGAGLIAVLLAIVVCTFDLFASLVVVMALMAVLMAVIIFPGLAVVGLHHGARNVITDMLSRVASLLISAVLYAAAAGVNSRATVLLLTTNVVPLQLAVLLLAILPIVMWILIRRLRNKPVVPRPLMYAAGLFGMRYWTRGGARAGVEQGLAEQGDFWSYNHAGNYQNIYVFGGWPGGRPNWWWTPPNNNWNPNLGGGGGGGGGGWIPPGGGGGLPPPGGGGGPNPPPGGGGPLPPPGGGGGPNPPPGGGGPLPPPSGGSGGGGPNPPNGSGGDPNPPNGGGQQNPHGAPAPPGVNPPPNAGAGRAWPSAGWSPPRPAPDPAGAPGSPSNPIVLTKTPGSNELSYKPYDGGPGANSAPDNGGGGS